MSEISSENHLEIATKFRSHVSLYVENRDLLLMGGYVQGQDANLDEAISMWPKILDFISQKENEKTNFENCIKELLNLYKKE